MKTLPFPCATPAAATACNAALRAYPVAYLKYGALLADYPGLDLPEDLGQLLLAAAQDPRHVYTFLLGFEDYADLPEARAIAKKAIETAPLAYLSLYNSDEFPAALRDPSFMPTMDQLWAAFNFYKEESSYELRPLILHYDLYAHLPGARVLLQAVIDSDPVAFFVGWHSHGFPEKFNDPEKYSPVWKA